MTIVHRIRIGLILLLPFVFTACIQNSSVLQDTSTSNTKIPRPDDQRDQTIASASISTESHSLAEQNKLVGDIQDSEIDKLGKNQNSLETEEFSNLWNRLFSLYALPRISHSKIDVEIRWFIKHPEHLARVQKRAEPYLYDIVEQIEKNNIPGEIALLPVIESAFRPYAFSHGSAVGIWQFVPGTGKRFGLKRNWWYDGRRDVYASTRAAMRYLKRLNKEFDKDWLLALAAYNSGEGRVARAIRKNKKQHKPSDFWHLKLPRETRSYVPRLLAVAEVFRNAERYGIALRDIRNEPVFEAIDIGSQLDLSVAADLADTKAEDLFLLNPGFNRWATAPKGPHILLVPEQKADVFRANLAKLDEKDRLNWTRHKIRKGETLGHISEKYGTTSSALRQINNIRGHLIRAGKHLLVPVAQSNPAYNRNLLAASRNGSGQQIVYKVRSGDSFWTISRKHSVSMRKLAKWNNMAPRDILRPGKKLTIWTKTSRNQSNPIINPIDPFHTINYTVRKGDSLYLISRRFNVKIADLRRWNNQRIGKYLKPGQKLKVRVDITKSTT